MVNDLVITYDNSSIEFDLEQYNQLFIYDYYTFFKVMIKLKEYEGIKFDEYHSEFLKSDLYLFNQKCTKKDLLVLDLNDFSKIISNLTFQKGSLLKEIYLDMLEENVSLEKIDEFTNCVRDLFLINEYLELDYKNPEIFKILDMLFIPHFKEEENYLRNPNLIVDIIIRYITIREKRCIVIIDSSIKSFDYSKLIDDNRIIVVDTSIDLNINSSNLIFFKENFVETVKLEDFIHGVLHNFPFEISQKQIEVLLKTYLRIILNDELALYDKPTDNLITLYIVIRKILNLKLNKIELKKIYDKGNNNIFLRDTLNML